MSRCPIQNRPITARPWRLLALLAWVWLNGTELSAKERADAQRVYDISAGEAVQTLKEFSEQSGEELLYSAKAVLAVRTNPVKGAFSASAALERLLANTPLQAVRNAKTGGYAIVRSTQNRPEGSAPPGPSDDLSPSPKATQKPSTHMKRKNPLALLGAWLALAIAPGQHADAAAVSSGAGSITGTVSNSATGNLLEGARVEVAGTGLSTLSDNTGRYVLSAVPSGSHEIVVSYIGLDPVRVTVNVSPSAQVVRNFDLTTAIYQLAEFRVTGEREGDALALTAQRNADNVKNVVAMDSFGNLPNMSAGEVLMRLPGIAGNPTDEGLAYAFSVRGMAPALNTVTIDGGLLPTIGTNRAFEMQSITGTMFEQLEVIKGHTPDKGADSLGGTINMKTRSPLNLREKRRVTYSATVRMAPSFTEQIPLREEHRAHPLLTVGYQEVFGVLGGDRNLGVAVNLFYSENAVGGYGSERQYQHTLNEPAYVWDYRTWENFNNRKQQSVNVKMDYRYSFNSKYSLTFTGQSNIEKFRRLYSARAFTGSGTTVPNATTSGVMPGFTDKVTQVRPIAGANLDIGISGPNNYFVRTMQGDFGGEHEYGPLKIDYNAGLGRTKQEAGTGWGTLSMRINNIGWILDRTESEIFPRFTQTAGPDITDGNNYRPVANGLSRAPATRTQEVAQLRGNVLYQLPTRMPLSLKTGFAWRKQDLDELLRSRRWSYIGTDPIPANSSMESYRARKTGLNLPYWETAGLTHKGQGPVNAALWREDLYFAEQQKYTGTRGLAEEVGAAYLMAQGRLGADGWAQRTGFLGGVRWERTDTESYGWVRQRFGSTAAQQQADPVGSAERDYANTRRDLEGRYSGSYPSIHLTHDVTRNLKARLSWSTSFGRPPLSSLLPTETISEANQTVTVSNPALLPQRAENWDFTLDYYFEPVGNLSLGLFHKSISDYIISNVNTGTVEGGPDNGYNGEYEGFTRLSQMNAGTATVRGIELSYQQQFTFLPGLLRGLSGSANYTFLETEGDFGGTTILKGSEVPGFIPRAGNVSLSWRYRRFSTRVLYNYTGLHISSYSALSPAANEWRMKRDTVNLGFAYQLRPAITLTCDIANIFKEPQQRYMGVPGRLRAYTQNFATVTVGVSGRF